MCPVFEKIAEISASDCKKFFVKGPYGDRNGRQQFAHCRYWDPGSRFPLRISFIGTDRYPGGYYRKRVDSRIFVITAVIEGDLRFVQDSREYLVLQNQFIVIHPRATHEFEPGPSGYTHTFSARIDSQILDTLLHTLGLCGVDVLRPKEPERIIEIMNRAFTVAREKQHDYWSRLSVLAYELLVLLAKCSGTDIYPKELGLALDYIHRQIGSRLSIEAMCKAAATSRSNLHKLFVMYMHLAPMAYVKKQRIEHAAAELCATELSVKRIALNVGYVDQLHFSREFRRHLGVSPRAYREQGGNLDRIFK